MRKKTIIRIVTGTGSLLVVLFIVLCMHLYAVAKKSREGMIQLSRIDFEQPIDSADALKIKAYVAGMPGVKGTYFNIPQGNFVYGYLVGTQRSEEVFEKVMAFTGHQFKAERYIVTEQQRKQGCPAGMDNSFTGGLSNLLLKIFN